MNRRIALVLEYEGTAYAGFQLQRNRPSIQGTVEEAIQRVTGQQSRLRGAGRTDAGVHATGQVAVFDTPSKLSPDKLQRALNFYLPDDVAVMAAYDVAPAFDPRRAATARTYRYTFWTRSRSPLLRRTVYEVGRALDVPLMRRALQHLEGYRDFGPFSGKVPQGKSTRRRLYRTGVWTEDAAVHMEMEGNAFLPHQVRRTAGAVLQVGLRRQTLEEFIALADHGKAGAAEETLPPHGLCLRHVAYKGFPPKGHAATTNDHTYEDIPGQSEMARY